MTNPTDITCVTLSIACDGHIHTTTLTEWLRANPGLEHDDRDTVAILCTGQSHTVGGGVTPKHTVTRIGVPFRACGSACHGFSVFDCPYENTLVGGFVQRCDECESYSDDEARALVAAFGVTLDDGRIEAISPRGEQTLRLVSDWSGDSDVYQERPDRGGNVELLS